MKNRLLFSTIVLCCFLVACSPSPQTNNETDVVEVTSQDSNTLIITERCAVIFDYSLAEIDSMRAEYSEEDFAEIASDVGYYNATARESLEAKGVKVVTTDKKTIVFVQTNGEKTSIERKQYDKDLVFFSPDKKPLGTFTADHDGDLSYFGINAAAKFSEGYWVDSKLLDNTKSDYIFTSFHKTSFINDEPLLQIFSDGDIKVEEVLLLQDDGSYKHPTKAIFYTFNHNDEITITESGTVRGLAQVLDSRIKE